MTILAIDPGCERSAWVLYDQRSSWTGIGEPQPEWPIEGRGTEANDIVRSVVLCAYFDNIAIEMIASYGMAVGAEIFETCLWVGRFIECAAQRGRAVAKVYRKDVKLTLCADSRAKDANIRQAVIDRFGGKEKAIGKKKSPGPLHAIHGDEWAALSVAITFAEQNGEGIR